MKKPRPAKEKDLEAQQELDLLQPHRRRFERNESAAVLGLKEDEEKAIRSFQLLTLKPELAFFGHRRRPAQQAAAARPGLPDHPARDPGPSEELEMELHDLSAEDRAMFMEDLGIKGFVRDLDVLRAIFTGMGQQVFFTVGEDECRAWPVRKGRPTRWKAQAGQIHTDLKRAASCGRRWCRTRIFEPRRFDERGEEPGCLSARREDVYREGWATSCTF